MSNTFYEFDSEAWESFLSQVFRYGLNVAGSLSFFAMSC